MQRAARFLKFGISRLSNFTKGVIKVIARLFGVRETSHGQGYDSTQLSSAVWIFILGIPAGLFLMGVEFPVLVWMSIVFGTLAIVNLDEALMLTALYAEHGARREETSNA